MFLILYWKRGSVFQKGEDRVKKLLHWAEDISHRVQHRSEQGSEIVELCSLHGLWHGGDDHNHHQSHYQTVIIVIVFVISKIIT